MVQQLTMPFVRQMMLCGYKNREYKKGWGYDHFGVDISTIQGKAGDDPTVYASGTGVVLAAGRDNKLGWGLAVLYPGCKSRTGEVRDLVLRYMHLRSICVGAGDCISRGQAVGTEGKEGTADYHLHLEMDTDIREQFAAWSPQVAGGTFWRRGEDSTVEPSLWLFVGRGQTIVEPDFNTAWLGEADMTIPRADEEITGKPGDKTLSEYSDAEIGAAVRQLFDMLGGK